MANKNPEMANKIRQCVETWENYWHDNKDTYNEYIQFVFGNQEDEINFTYIAGIQNGSTSVSHFGVGFDSTSTFGIGQNIWTIANASVQSTNAGVWAAGTGIHTLSANEEMSSGTNATFNNFSLNALTASIRM